MPPVNQISFPPRDHARPWIPEYSPVKRWCFKYKRSRGTGSESPRPTEIIASYQHFKVRSEVQFQVKA